MRRFLVERIEKERGQGHPRHFSLRERHGNNGRRVLCVQRIPSRLVWLEWMVWDEGKWEMRQRSMALPLEPADQNLECPLALCLLLSNVLNMEIYSCHPPPPLFFFSRNTVLKSRDTWRNFKLGWDNCTLLDCLPWQQYKRWYKKWQD